MSVVSRYQLGWLTLCGLSRALTSHSRAWLGVVVPGIRLDVKTSYFPGLNPSWCTVISESEACRFVGRAELPACGAGSTPCG